MAKRISEIDGLRGLAAVSVMIGHWGEAVTARADSPAVQRFLTDLFLTDFSFGRLGIVAFFCISGFVVPFSFRGARPLVAFPISRAFRLYPAYWLSILVAVLVYPLVDGPPLTVPQVVANLTMVQLLLGQPHVVGAYWTLTIELVFYGLCYVLFAARLLHSARTNFVMTLLFLAMALAIGGYRGINPGSDLPLGIPTYLAAMHFGTLARLALLENDALAKRLYPLTAILLVTTVTVANTIAYYNAHNELVGWLAADIGYIVGVALFLGCVHRQWFAGAIWIWLGQISYSTYLLHMIAIAAGSAAFALFSNWWIATAVITPCYFAITLAAAALSQRWIERPAVRLGRWTERLVEERLFHVSPAPALDR